MSILGPDPGTHVAGPFSVGGAIDPSIDVDTLAGVYVEGANPGIDIFNTSFTGHPAYERIQIASGATSHNLEINYWNNGTKTTGWAFSPTDNSFISAGGLTIGGGAYGHVLIAAGLDDGRANHGNPLTEIHQVSFYTALHGNSGASGAGSFVAGFETALGTQAGSFTVELITNYSTGTMSKGAGTTITRTIGMSTYDETAGTHNASIADYSATFTGNWFIYTPSVRPSYFGGAITSGGIVTGAGITASISDGSPVNTRLVRTGATPTDWFIYIPTGSTDLRWYASGDRMTLTSGGVLTLSGVVATGLAARVAGDRYVVIDPATGTMRMSATGPAS